MAKQIGLIQVIGVDVWKPIDESAVLESSLKEMGLTMDSKIDTQHYVASPISDEIKLNSFIKLEE